MVTAQEMGTVTPPHADSTRVPLQQEPLCYRNLVEFLTQEQENPSNAISNIQMCFPTFLFLCFTPYLC